MKTITRVSLILTAVSALALSSTGLSVNATEKGAEQLAKRTAPASNVVNSAKPMNCSSCTDSWVSVTDKGTKGPNHQVKNVVRHNCASCDTQVVTKGAGKTAYNVTVHTCGNGSASVCATR